MTEHSTAIKDYKSMKDLAHDVSNLRYDALAEFLYELSRKMHNDSCADYDRGRTRLSKSLREASYHLTSAKDSIIQAQIICEKHMN